MFKPQRSPNPKGLGVDQKRTRHRRSEIAGQALCRRSLEIDQEAAALALSQWFKNPGSVDCRQRFLSSKPFCGADTLAADPNRRNANSKPSARSSGAEHV